MAISTSKARPSLYERWHRYLFQSAPQLVVLHVPIGVDVDTDAERAVVWDKVTIALELIAGHDPRRWKRFREDVRGILVFGSVGALGAWLPRVRLVVVQADYVLASNTSPGEIATTLVHEGTHAWLGRRGIEYDEPRRHRIETFCVRSEISFARRMPDAEEIISRAERLLAMSPSSWSNAARLERSVANLAQLGVPRWITSMLLIITRLRLRATRNRESRR